MLPLDVHFCELVVGMDVWW